MLTSKNFVLHNRYTREMKKKKQVGIFKNFTSHALLTFALPYSKCELTTDRSMDESD